MDADAILAYDSERGTPCATPEIEGLIRAICDKPHFAPVVLSEAMQDLRRQLSEARDAANLRAQESALLREENRALRATNRRLRTQLCEFTQTPALVRGLDIC